MSTMMNFYVENKADECDLSDSSSYSPPMKKCCQPMDLSRRDSLKTPSLCSDRSCSPSESAAFTATHHQYSPLDHPSRNSDSTRNVSRSSHEQRDDTPSPDFAFFGSENLRLSACMIEAMALQRLLSTPSAIDYSSDSDSLNHTQQNVERDGKMRRPFKSYPEHHLFLPFGENNETAEKYKKFRMENLKRIEDSRGGQLIKTNPKMRRTGITYPPGRNNVAAVVVESDVTGHNSDSSNGCVRDSTYLERREKNNAAAKRSRDRRKIKEDEIAIQAAFLESVNREYKSELNAARHELAQLKCELALVRRQLLTCCGKGCPAAKE